jgi:hypothetical protein
MEAPYSRELRAQRGGHFCSAICMLVESTPHRMKSESEEHRASIRLAPSFSRVFQDVLSAVLEGPRTRCCAVVLATMDELALALPASLACALQHGRAIG